MCLLLSWLANGTWNVPSTFALGKWQIKTSLRKNQKILKNCH
jgi:hypothetical protein